MTHVRTLLDHSSKILTALVAAALIFTWTANATADGPAANKVAVAGSETEVFGPGDKVLLLDETFKVSSPRDLILQLTSECSLLTALSTDTEDSERAAGEIVMWIEIDGKRVPVSQENTDEGEVVFCNRVYERQVTDQEDDGVDREDDYIDTRTANAFNWFAQDAGVIYDSPANGQNILDVRVFGRLTETNSCNNSKPILGQTCAEAIVGNRTLIVENTNAQNGEVVTETDPSPAPAPAEEPKGSPTDIIPVP